MATYAALVSLMNIIEQIQNHPRPPISLDEKQVEYFVEKVTFLQHFLEDYSHIDSKEIDDLEISIADAAYWAEDVIDSFVGYQILARSISHGEEANPIDFYQGLKKMIQQMDFVKKKVTEIKKMFVLRDEQQRNSMRTSSSGLPPTKQGTIVSLSDVLNEIMGRLIGGRLDRQIIPIVGMGGIGKTTLAKQVYINPLIVQYFDVLAWVTIAEEYNTREILLQVLCQLKKHRREEFSPLSEEDIGVVLHRELSGRRYLIIMDDIWSIEVWDKVKFFFPDNSNGSKIIITTRLSNVALQLTGSHGIKMNFLGEDASWNLLCKTVFGKELCPPVLEEIGKKIAKSCGGLPLSIVVIGGVLSKSERTGEHWEYILKNLNPIVSLEEDERCLKILHTSYKQLPVHLKPCFLYMGVFPQGNLICVSELMKLWVAEGFLKPISGQSMEAVGQEYLHDLIDRNLILVHKLGFNGKIKVCRIHDILRDVCVTEAHKHKFLCVTKHHSLTVPQGISTHRRIAIQRSTLEETSLSQFLHALVGDKSETEHFPPRVLHAVQSALRARSLICEFEGVLPSLDDCRMLRVFKAGNKDSYSTAGCLCSVEVISKFLNLRFLALDAYSFENFKFPSSVHYFWNLQTLIIRGAAQSDIWKMPKLRHVECDKICLTDPPCGQMTDGHHYLVMENLQTLLMVANFKFSADIIQRIPNVTRLKILYVDFEEGSQYCFDSLDRLIRLESLGCYFHCDELRQSGILQNIVFPRSLKELTLSGCQLSWKDMATKIGPLPLLQVLKLKCQSFIGPEWETVQEQFCSLKFLLIEECFFLEHWTTDCADFPRLERLILRNLPLLREIPSSLGDITTLQSIQLEGCSDSVLESAKRMLQEQEELGNVGLRVEVRSFGG